MKWLTRLIVENDFKAHEFIYESNNKRDWQKTYFELISRYNGYDYGSTSIKDECGNELATLQKVSKVRFSPDYFWVAYTILVLVFIGLLFRWN